MRNLIATIEQFHKDNNEKALGILNIVANLLYECEQRRETCAKYQRTFKIGRLKIDVDFNNEK